MWRKIAKCYPPQLELVPLVLLIYAFQVVMSHYSSLPESVPSHFGTSGLPDEWAGKSTLLLFPVIGLVVYLMFSGLNVLFALVRNPRSFINLPEKQKARLTDADAEGLRVFLCRTMFAMKVIIVGM
ncbi:MAG: DUF1648 domain-containing protein, partial [Chloroflexi bacterium]|nr:DUF1648 domain-containing protein [Chloroflexota bacterium]